MNERILLYETYKNVNRLGIGLRWKPQTDANQRIDLDISAFLLDSNQSMPSPHHIIFYHNKKSVDESILHLGDSRSGEERRDDEIILVSVDDVQSDIEEIAVVITIYNEGVTVENTSFMPVSGAFVRLFDYQTNKEILRYDINEHYNDFNGLEFGKLMRTSEGWVFEITGTGSKKGLEGYIDQFA